MCETGGEALKLPLEAKEEDSDEVEANEAGRLEVDDAAEEAGVEIEESDALGWMANA